MARLWARGRGAAAFGRGPRQSLKRVRPTPVRSAALLAEAFGAPIYEPIWWPEHTQSVGYELTRLPSGLAYHICAERRGGGTIRLVGRFGIAKAPEAKSGPGQWHSPPQLAPWFGAVCTAGSKVQAVVHLSGQTLQQIGRAHV